MKVKIIIFVFSVILWGVTSCGGRSANNSHSRENHAEHNHNTHIHADGTVHSDHAPEQESFKVEADSAAVKADTVKHDHDHDHSAHGHQH